MSEIDNSDDIDVLEKPVVPKHFYTVPSDNAIFFHTSGKTVLMEGQHVAGVVTQLLELLDGSHTVSEIIELHPNPDKHAILATLQQMRAKGLVIDATRSLASDLLDAETRRFEPQMAFLSRFVEDAREVQSSLGDCRVDLFLVGDYGWSVAASLATAGIGNLRIADSWSLRSGDWIAGFEAGQNDAGRQRSQVVGEYLRQQFPWASVTGIGSLPASVEETTKDFIHGADLIILCLDRSDESFAQMINTASVETAIPWIRCYSDGMEATIGPLVVPGETACYECYRLRRSSNQDRLSERETISTFMSGIRDQRSRFGRLRAVDSIVSGIVALEAARHLTGFRQPVTCGQSLHIDFLSMETRLHRVLKVPRCPTCSRLRTSPQVRMWMEE